MASSHSILSQNLVINAAILEETNRALDYIMNGAANKNIRRQGIFQFHGGPSRIERARDVVSLLHRLHWSPATVNQWLQIEDSKRVIEFLDFARCKIASQLSSEELIRYKEMQEMNALKEKQRALKEEQEAEANKPQIVKELEKLENRLAQWGETKLWQLDKRLGQIEHQVVQQFQTRVVNPISKILEERAQHAIKAQQEAAKNEAAKKEAARQEAAKKRSASYPAQFKFLEDRHRRQNIKLKKLEVLKVGDESINLSQLFQEHRFFENPYELAADLRFFYLNNNTVVADFANYLPCRESFELNGWKFEWALQYTRALLEDIFSAFNITFDESSHANWLIVSGDNFERLKKMNASIIRLNHHLTLQDKIVLLFGAQPRVFSLWWGSLEVQFNEGDSALRKYIFEVLRSIDTGYRYEMLGSHLKLESSGFKSRFISAINTKLRENYQDFLNLLGVEIDGYSLISYAKPVYRFFTSCCRSRPAREQEVARVALTTNRSSF